MVLNTAATGSEPGVLGLYPRRISMGVMFCGNFPREVVAEILWIRISIQPISAAVQELISLADTWA